MRKRILISDLLLLCIQGLIESVSAQRGGARSRITQRDTAVVRLTNTTHPRLRIAIDRGRVSADLPIERVVLMFKSSPEQEVDLEQFLGDQQNPSSPQFHRWLTPEQFGERFGASLEDVALVTAWLEGHGRAK